MKQQFLCLRRNARAGRDTGICGDGVSGFESDLEHPSSSRVPIDTKFVQHAQGDTVADSEQRKREISGTDLRVRLLSSLPHRPLEQLPRSRSTRLADSDHGPRGHECHDVDAHIVIRHTERGERSTAGTAAIVQNAQQQMLRADMSMVERGGVVQGRHYHWRAPSVNRSNIQMPAYDHVGRHASRAHDTRPRRRREPGGSASGPRDRRPS